MNAVGHISNEWANVPAVLSAPIDAKASMCLSAQSRL